MKHGLRHLVIVGVIGTVGLSLQGGVLAEESKVDATRIVIYTSGPVAYRHLYHSNPPKITFRFFQNTVYSRMQESVSIQKGIVKGIDATYFKKYPIPGAKRPLKTLTFHLLAETTYEVSEGPQSIILVIRHPKEILGSEWVEGKVLLTAFPMERFQEEARNAEIAGAFQKAMAKLAPPQAVQPTEPSPPTTIQLTPVRPTQIMPPAPTVSPSSPLPPSPLLPTTPWFQNPMFYGLLLLCVLLGGLLWPPSWFSIQNRLLRQEQNRSWGMAKRIIMLKEESVSHEERYAEVIAKREEEARSLQSQRLLLQGANQKLQKERIELAYRQKTLQSELQDLSERYDQEIARRRDLESALEALKGKRERSGALGEEKRQWTRLPIFPINKQDLPLTVEVQGPAGRLIYGYPKDVSLGGISFELGENVKLPETLSLTLFFPKQKSAIVTQGKVVWGVQGSDKSHYGICFMDLPQNGTALISQFVRERFPQVNKARRAFEAFSDKERPA